MRYFFGFICALALGVVGCSETSGAQLCEGVTCEDTECKTDGVCDASDGMCDYALAEDGTACSEGECLGGVCAPAVLSHAPNKASVTPSLRAAVHTTSPATDRRRW